MDKDKKIASNNNFPFANETKQAKYDFKKMIDEMSDEEFIDFYTLFFEFLYDIGFLDNDEIDDLEFDEIENDEELPF